MRDNLTKLRKGKRLYLDDRWKTNFRCSESRNKLSRTAGRLVSTRHVVKIAATEAGDNVANKGWRFGTKR